jgi:tRNA-modifying protein YgfZ
MEHRGTARRRIVTARGTALPARGSLLKAGGRSIGMLGSSANGVAAALVRLDRAKEAIDNGLPILAGETPVDLALPPWARFGWPTGPSENA